MTVHFIRGHRAYLPEVGAYRAFIEDTFGRRCHVHDAADSVPRGADVVWWMCGRASRSIPGVAIHEYASASVPPLAGLKDAVKAVGSARPQYRLFQNAYVRSCLPFRDRVPFCYRAMGVHASFFSQERRASPEYDLVYAGDLQRLLGFRAFLDAMARAGRRVLLVGAVPPVLTVFLRARPALTATGPVRHEEVPALLARARAGLNLVPDERPFHRQASTKLLEYCAMGLPVVTTDYAWVRAFERERGARFCYLRADPVDLEAFDFRTPRVDDLEWKRVLAALPLWEWLGWASSGPGPSGQVPE